jgi:heme A synthase
MRLEMRFIDFMHREVAVEKRNRLYPVLAFVTALMTLGLIVFGAVVRVTDSGLGCGQSWPLCNGTVIPPLDNLTAWIEWLHRLFAVLIGLFGLATLALAFRAYRQRNRPVLTYTVIAAVLFALQSALGAFVVMLDLPPTFVTLHLGTAMLLLAALLAAALYAVYRPRVQYGRDSFTSLGIVTAVLSLIIILTGALVRGSGATLACTDWPLCNGSIFPFNQGQLQIIHMLHRVAVLGLGAALILLVWQAYTRRQHRTVRMLAVGSLVVFLMQAGVGAGYVLSSADAFWGAAHVAFAALTWALLVALSVIDYMNTRSLEMVKSEGNTAAWTGQSQSLTN